MDGANSSWLLAATLGCIVLFLPPELAAQQAAQAPSDKDSTIRVTVDSVLVPVIVRDAQGRAIGNLTKDDFQIFDRGKPQKISAFTIETRAPNESATSALTPPVNAASGAVTPPAIPALDATPPRCTVLLFDDMHLNEGDLMRAKAVGTKLLTKPIRKREAVAVVSMSGSNSGLMQDSAKLQKAVANLHLTNLYRKFGPECPDVNYVEADRIMNKHDGTALDVAMANYATCSNAVGLTKEIAQSTVEGVARHVLELGSQDARVSLSFIAGVVQRMKTLPGRRTLVLVSPGFLAMTPESLSEKSQILDMAAQANVTINALDARGLYTTELDASERGARSLRELTTGAYQDYQREAGERAGNVLGELADGTGGTYFHNSNDLEGGLRQVLRRPSEPAALIRTYAEVRLDGEPNHSKRNESNG